MTNLLLVLQSLSLHIPSECNTYDKREYDLSCKSSFLDIGSGFGKPVFHAAIQTGCIAKGIEIVPARVEFSLGFLYDYREERATLLTNAKQNPQSPIQEEKMTDDEVELPSIKQFDKLYNTCFEELSKVYFDNSLGISDFESNIKCQNKNMIVGLDIKKPIKKKESKIYRYSKGKLQAQCHYDYNWIDRVTFDVSDAEKILSYYISPGKAFTHIYSYNKIMGEETLCAICSALNCTDYRVLAWYFDEKETEKFGLRNFKLVHKMPMPSTGKECFTCYIFIKLKN